MSRGRTSVVLFWLAAFPAGAQQFTHLSGYVLDPSEAGIPHASIHVVNEETGFRRSAESGPDGAYGIASLQPGAYRIVVRREGFRTVIRFGIRLRAAQPTRLDVTLPVGSMQDAITVEGDAPPLPASDAAVASTVLRSEIERLPLNGRGVLGLIELTPGTVATPATRGEPGQFTVNGQRPNANYFTVDGVSANSGVSGGGVPAQATGGAMPGLSAFGSMDSLISPEALQELRIQTSTAPADFGRMPGAAVSLTSRSGSSEFHGSAAYRFRHERLAANDWFANRSGDARAPFRLHKADASLGGPILRNRTFFFLAYEAISLRQPFAWRAPVPSLEARRDSADWVRPVLALFPAPNGGDLGGGLAEWTGRNRQPAGLQYGSVRVDHAVTARITLWGRYQDAPSHNEFGNTQVNRLAMRSRALTLGVNYQPAAGAAIDLRANGSWARADSTWMQPGDPCALETAISTVVANPNRCRAFVRFSISGVGQLVDGNEGVRLQNQYQAVAGASFTLPAHTPRLGADRLRLAPIRRDSSSTLSVLAENLADLTDTRYLWSGAAAAQRGSIVVRELSLWAHDTWQAASRLTLTGGLRWEDSPAPEPRDPVNFLDPSGLTYSAARRPLWPRTLGNFAPRFGLAWGLDRGGRTVLRAGAGWFYDSSLSIAADTVNGGPLSVARHGSSRHAPFPSLLAFGFRPDLRLPAVAQWSLQIERALDAHNSIAASYVGSAGFRLLRREMGGEGSTPTIWIALATNHGRSRYHGLQAQYRRRFAARVQALASYSWSHSVDNASSDSLLYWTGPGTGARADRASSDFDLRHVFSAGVTAALWRGWSADGLVRARSGFPFSVLASEQYTGITLANAFRANVIPGKALWLDAPGEPPGRRLNPAAFASAGDAVQGSLGRNALSGFGNWQIDAALRREFRLWERVRLQLRIEAFNALNHAAFADPVRFLDSPLFGRPPSMLNLMLGTGSPGSGLAPIFQNGAPRSFQVGMRLGF